MTQEVPQDRTRVQCFERRQRIQKLRWLGLHDEADQLASSDPTAKLAEREVPLPADCPETD